MATTTISHVPEPTESLEGWGDVHLSSSDKVYLQIFLFGCVGLLAATVTSMIVYLTFIKPRRLRAASKAAANGDVEKQSNNSRLNARSGNSPYSNSKSWGSDDTINVASPTKAVMYKSTMQRTTTKGAFSDGSDDVAPPPKAVVYGKRKSQRTANGSSR